MNDLRREIESKQTMPNNPPQSDTPRTDAILDELALQSLFQQRHLKLIDFARTLERELNEAKKAEEYEHADKHKILMQRDQWQSIAERLAKLIYDTGKSSLHYDDVRIYPFSGFVKALFDYNKLTEETKK